MLLVQLQRLSFDPTLSWSIWLPLGLVADLQIVSAMCVEVMAEDDDHSRTGAATIERRC